MGRYISNCRRYAVNTVAIVPEDPAACVAAHAVANVVGTVHVETHAVSFVVMYAYVFGSNGH